MTGGAAASSPVRVRFAPSPTGYLHVGGARTALFNWLFARRHGGAFILRIEDTDRERSKQEFVAEILDSMQWLGLCCDEPPYFQSRRLERYRQAADKLLASGQAYHCWCPAEDLEKRRQEAQAKGGTFHYDGRCRGLAKSEVDDLRRRGQVPAVRVSVPEGLSAWEDMVRGTVAIDHAQLDDFVIMKSDGMPTYHFAVVVDDVDMRISHVIRGEDHISNTPKQLVLYKALGIAPPVFGHIPLIHGSDGGRLSKRHGATAVSDYRRMGILSAALVNYLALLGWSPGDDREVITIHEMVDIFDIERVVKTPAVFDMEKLRWMNHVYYSRLSLARRADYLIPYWLEAGFIKPGEDQEKREWLENVVSVVGERIKVLTDIIPQTEFLFRDKPEPDEAAAKMLKKASGEKELFGDIHRRLAALADFKRESIEETIRAVVTERGLGAGKVMQPLRAAVTGKLASPGLFECMELLGRERTLSRLEGHLL